MSAVRKARPEPACSPDWDLTSARIRAFIASMQSLRGVAGWESDDYHQRGWQLLERMAKSADQPEMYDDPRIRLNADDCACVLKLLAQIQPKRDRDWWKDPEGGPSHVVGLQFVLFVLHESVLKLGRTRR